MSHGNLSYFIKLINEYYILTFVYMKTKKPESPIYFAKQYKLSETHTDNLVLKFSTIQPCKNESRNTMVLYTDNGDEYISNTFKKHFLVHGFAHQTTTAYNPQQYGAAERKIKNFIAHVQSMLHGKGIEKAFKAKALHTAVYIRNGVTSRWILLISHFSIVGMEISHLITSPHLWV